MALNNGIASVSFLCFIILSTLTAANSKEQKAPGTGGSPPATGDCPLEYISYHMIGLSEKTKEFLKDDIINRLGDKSIKGADRECLNKFFNKYQAALGFIEKAINDLSVKRYSEAKNDLLAYSTSVDDSLKCSVETPIISTPYTDMERWAQFTVKDILNKLKGCSSE